MKPARSFSPASGIQVLASDVYYPLDMVKDLMFQSRKRDSSFSKLLVVRGKKGSALFQSRKRDSDISDNSVSA